MLKWNRAECELLITLYKQYPELYNTNHPNYHKREEREQCWDKIINRIKQLKPGLFETKELKEKIKSIRTQFAREKYMEKKKKDDLNDPYVPKLWCYNQLSFLKNCGFRSKAEVINNIYCVV